MEAENELEGTRLMPRNRTLAVAVAAAALAGGRCGRRGGCPLARQLTPGSRARGSRSSRAANRKNVAATSTLSLEQIAKQSTPSVVEVDATSTGSQSQSPFP